MFLLGFLYSCNQTSGLTEDPGYKTEVVLNGYEIIWGLDFLPGGEFIFTEKKGNIYRKSGDVVTKLTGVPEVLSKGQGGMLDIRVHPDYSENGWIYVSYSTEGTGGDGKLMLARFRIDGDMIKDLENIFSTDASNKWYGHYGSRIEFDNEKHLYLSVGEGGQTTYAGKNKKNNNAQEVTSPWGKIHRLNDDGSIPADNPVFEQTKKTTSVYSYGHRNPQGLALNPSTNELWESEHGPKGGDELNLIKKGANYGWPDFSFGINYDGTEISEGHSARSITEPVFDWVPSIGTCGMIFVKGNKYKELEGNILVAGLVTGKVHRCSVSGGKITEKEPVASFGRVRDIAQAPDGTIYISIENPGRIIRLIPE